MKSAYELAMERLAKSDPSASRTLTDEDKAKLAEIDTLYRSKIAEKEVFLGGLLEKAKAAGSFEEIRQLEEQLTREVKLLKDRCDEEKEAVRSGGK